MYVLRLPGINNLGLPLCPAIVVGTHWKYVGSISLIFL